MTSPNDSRRHPHLQAATEAQLRTALAAGLLEESHHLELKRELGPKPKDNVELARDVCALAIDGGTLVVGVAEDDDTGLHLHPVPLHGLAERIEQIVRSRTDPPLAVTFTTITTEADPAHGYLLVQVPPSPDAPHMVENVYYGRGDKTKHRLSDTVVRELHRRHATTEADTLALLQGVIDDDPVPENLRRQAHLFLLATPTTGSRGMLAALTTNRDAQARLHGFPVAAGLAPPVITALDALASPCATPTSATSPSTRPAPAERP